MKYTGKELDDAALADLRIDYECALAQAHNGPYYPEKGITKESLVAYANECHKKLVQYQDGGAHKGLMNG